MARTLLDNEPLEMLVPPGEELSELDQSIAVGVDLVKGELQILRRHFRVGAAHEADEFAQRKPPIVIDVVEIEILP